MRTCSYCGRENPDQAALCTGCLSPLSSTSTPDAVVPPKLEDVREGEAGKRIRATGAVWLVGGLTFSLLNYMAAAHNPHGGRYFVAIGAICYGAMRFFQGHAMVAGRMKDDERAQPLLDLAARLEDVDREKAK